MSAAALIRAGDAVPARPWPRHRLSPAAWDALAATLAGQPLELLALWADAEEVHALFLEDRRLPLLASVAPVQGRYRALSPARPAAGAQERAVRELWGHVAEGSAGPAAWLDHGRWTEARPLSPQPVPARGAAEPPEFAAPDDPVEYQVGLGPVNPQAGPAHLRLTAAGERVTRAELRAGYTHRGLGRLLAGRTPEVASGLIARVEAQAGVAHGLAFAGAVEAALGVAAPPRALALREAAGELERLAIHLHVLAGAALAAGVAPPDTRLREALLRACGAAFGHRLLMGVVVPGGMGVDLAPDGAAMLLQAVDGLAAALPGLMLAHDGAAGLAGPARGRGVTQPGVVAVLATGGVAGRAAGRRMELGLPPEAVPTLREGDADARMRLRLAELPHALSRLRACLASLPDGPVRAPLPPGDGEGLGMAEGPHGDVWCWVRLRGGVVAAVHPADPAWRCWPAVERALPGTPLAEVPLVLRSFAATLPGMDL